MNFYGFALSLMALPLAMADFHITNLYNTAIDSSTGQTHWSTSVACPSNYWNCDCLTNGDRAGWVDGNPGAPFFAVHNLCGMDQLNFYLRDDGHYDMYQNNGDGSVIGTCYNNWGDKGKECGTSDGTTETTGGIVCYSYVCNP